jgi:hypothetical protein
VWGQGWIDHYTRAVLTQVKVYNVNTRLFSEITLVTEQTIAGEILHTTIIDSVNVKIRLDWCLVAFISFTCIQCIRVLMLTNDVGILSLFKNWRRLFEILIAVNALAVLIYLLLHTLTVPEYVTEYQEHVEELDFFHFYKLANYTYTARELLCLLFILNLIRFYSLWRFGRILFRIYLTIVKSYKFAIWLLVIFVLWQFVLFRAISYSFLTYFDVVFNPNMVYRHSLSKEMSPSSILRFAMSFLCVIIMVLFFFIFTNEYKSSKNELDDGILIITSHLCAMRLK